MKKAAWATDATLARMTELWTRGDTTNAMGRALGVSKGAVVGMVHRCHLPARPTPITRIHGPPPVPRPTIAAPTTIAPTTIAPTTIAPAAIAPAIAAPAVTPNRIVKPVTPPAAPQRPTFKHRGRIEPCCWVMVTGARTRLPIYCTDDSLPGLPYCGEHAASAYPAIKQLRTRNDADRGRPL